jgi:hypothetical protein
VTKKQLEAVEVEVVEDQPAETGLVLVRALMPLWSDVDVVPPGTEYRLPLPAAQYLLMLGMVEEVD